MSFIVFGPLFYYSELNLRITRIIDCKRCCFCFDKWQEPFDVEKELRTASAGADGNLFKGKAAFINIGREFFLHSDWRNAAADISRQLKQILHVNHFNFFIPCHRCGALEVDFLFDGDTKYQRSGFITVCDEGFEALFVRNSDLVGNMNTRQVVFVNGIGFDLV